MAEHFLRNVRATCAALALCFSTLAVAGGTGSTPNPIALRLGDPPRAPADVSRLPTGSGRFAASALSVDTADRAAVAQFYRLYMAANLVPSDWSGSVSNCQAGSTGADYKAATLQQVNFFRAMAGVPAEVSLDSDFSAKAQQAALIMSRNETLSHFPASNWSCYTADGSEAAGKSNLALGSAGPYAIKGYMDDTGANNTVVGHRRWIIYPQTKLMGTGDVTNAAKGGWNANALWVQDGNFGGPRPAGVRDDFVAWPPPGYVPYDLVPARWSLSYPDAAFSSASVSVTRDGQSVAVQLEPLANGYGENTLVWVLDGRDTSSPSVLSRPQVDTAYQVTVSGAIVGGQSRTFSYTVTIFDADPNAPGMAFVPAQPTLTVGRSVVVNVTGLSGSIAHISTGWSGGSKPVDVQFASSTSLKLTGLAPGTASITVEDAGGAKDILTVTVAAQGSASDWQISGRADGTAEAMTLVADVLPASLDDGKSGAFYVGAQLPDGSLYLNDGQTWVPYTGSTIPAHSAGTLVQRSFPVFIGLDVRGLSGTQVLIGYGTDANDLLNNGKYRSVYTVP